MSFNRDIRGMGPEHQDVRARPAPRCYSRPARSQAIRQPHNQTESTGIVLALGIFSCVAGFLLMSGSWGF
jgi:hypothetical protein